MDRKSVNNTTTLNGGFALAFAGSAMAITQPIQNSFIIVNTDKSVDTDKIYINKNIDIAEAQIDDFGPAVLINSPAYVNENIIIDNSTLPIGVTLEKEQYIARAGFRAGIHIEAKISGSTAVEGKFLYPNTQVVKLEVGSVIRINPDLSRTEIGRFFTNTNGEFFIEQLTPGEYKLELDNTDLSAFSFSIKEDQLGVVSLGIIQLQTSKSILE